MSGICFDIRLSAVCGLSAVSCLLDGSFTCLEMINTMTDEIELKRCPFCGGKAEMLGDDDKVYQVLCPNCNANIEEYDYEKNVSAERWNSRPIEDALKEENKRFRKALETICAIYEINGAEWRFDKRLYDVAKEALDNGSESRD